MSNPEYFVEQLCHISNTMSLPCRGERVFVLRSEADLPALSEAVASRERVHLIGSASNLVLPPVLEGFTVLVRNRGVSLVQESGGVRYVDVSAGEVWHDWVVHALGKGWNGLENLALIPGTVGAAPVQNIGAYGVEVERFIDSIRVWDLQRAQMKTLARQSCGFQYRDSIFKRDENSHLLIVSVRFALPVDWQPVLKYPDLVHFEHARTQGEAISAQEVFDAVVDIRRRKLPDPSVIPNSGSFFKNPVVSEHRYEDLRRSHPDLVSFRLDSGDYKLAAGWMIDQCGWKGHAVGPVMVHERQALVLTNTGGATQADVLDVARLISGDVKARFGVSLEIEPVCWDC
ncbi:UDP-N-acetylmuramate dehydrogenase [Orrella marina]|uniref:UDP-N-acetylenolpyruvoylglucosamine reductase n=1 Tax=Orrella marina TaxID=2163011 RepID=A0A2R4XK69_9BURK|nr:UDP-N-acetylmuramate dehydrogenase [Orrella marina]AWB34173.1 UDP-N-acetylenolpyruvoylglucosamine reductase [Orrella marina]